MGNIFDSKHKFPDSDWNSPGDIPKNQHWPDYGKGKDGRKGGGEPSISSITMPSKNLKGKMPSSTKHGNRSSISLSSTTTPVPMRPTPYYEITQPLPAIVPAATTTTVQVSGGGISNSASLSSGTSYSSPTATSTSANISTTAVSPLLPAYAIVLIVIAGLMGTAFLISLVLFCGRERRRQQADDGPDDTVQKQQYQPSYIRAAGRALAVATGVFAVIWTVRKLRGRSNETRDAGEEEEQQQHNYSRELYDGTAAAAAGSYTKLREEGGRLEDVEGRNIRDVRGINGGVPIPVYLDVRDAAAESRGALSPSSSAPLDRSGSLVSSLSSASEGRMDGYERLDRSPSPMTEAASYTSYT